MTPSLAGLYRSVSFDFVAYHKCSPQFYSDVEIQAQFTLNQSRIEEITMKEDLVMNNFIGDDAFGDIPFDQESEKEILRAGSLLEDSLHQENDASKITLDKGDQKDLTDSTLERSKIG